MTWISACKTFSEFILAVYFVFSSQLVLSSHRFFPRYVLSYFLFFSGVGCPRVIHEILWETLYYSPNVVFCRAGHTREILECTRNQVPLSILIIPFSSRPLKLPNHFCVTVAHSCFPSLSLQNEISIYIHFIFPLFNKSFLFLWLLNNDVLSFSNQCSLYGYDYLIAFWKLVKSVGRLLVPVWMITSGGSVATAILSTASAVSPVVYPRYENLGISWWERYFWIDMLYHLITDKCYGSCFKCCTVLDNIFANSRGIRMSSRPLNLGVNLPCDLEK